MSRLPLIEKIHILESKLGERWTHPLLEPFKFDSSDSVKVQEAGKKIAQHLGLPSFLFIIGYTQQKPNVAGHIQLDYSNDVYIEIDINQKNDFQVVLAILAHEICHKYLHLNNLKLFPENENEMLTDAATIYTGLGKLSLNGCEKISTSTSMNSSNTTTTTTTQKVGYMNREQFAFVYRLVCAMRRIPENIMLQGLTSESAIVVKNVSNTESSYFNEGYFYNHLASDRINEVLKNEVGNAQINFAKFNRNIRVIQESIVISANQSIKDFHSGTKTKVETLNSSVSKKFSKEAHNYIKNLIIIEEIEILKAKIKEKDIEIQKIKNAFTKFINHISTSYPKQFSIQNIDSLLQFDCPNCNNKMRIGDKKLARVKCPKCNYSFIVDTGVEEIQDTHKQESYEEPKAKKNDSRKETNYAKPSNQRELTKMEIPVKNIGKWLCIGGLIGAILIIISVAPNNRIEGTASTFQGFFTICIIIGGIIWAVGANKKI